MDPVGRAACTCSNSLRLHVDQCLWSNVGQRTETGAHDGAQTQRNTSPIQESSDGVWEMFWSQFSSRPCRFPQTLCSFFVWLLIWRAKPVVCFFSGFEVAIGVASSSLPFGPGPAHQTGQGKTLGGPDEVFAWTGATSCFRGLNSLTNLSQVHAESSFNHLQNCCGTGVHPCSSFETE